MSALPLVLHATKMVLCLGLLPNPFFENHYSSLACLGFKIIVREVLIVLHFFSFSDTEVYETVISKLKHTLL